MIDNENKVCQCGGIMHYDPYFKAKVCNSCGKMDRFYKNDRKESGDWIPCSERLPEEHESMFAKLKYTDKWDDCMFEKISDEVNVTVEFENGQRKTMTLHTCDGKWRTDIRIVKFEVIAWQPLPEPYKGDERKEV